MTTRSAYTFPQPRKDALPSRRNAEAAQDYERLLATVAEERHPPGAQEEVEALVQSGVLPTRASAVFQARLVARRRAAERDALQGARPIIDRLDVSTIAPGRTFTIYGSNLSREVFVAVTGDGAGYQCDIEGVDEVFSAGEPGEQTSEIVAVRARMTPYASGFRPTSEGGVIVTTGGVDSDFYVVAIDTNIEYWGVYVEETLQSSFGIPGKRDDTAGGGQLTDRDQRLYAVYRDHFGPGWSELRSPSASGDNLEQGFHIGNANFDISTMRITYWVSIPHGVSAAVPTTRPHRGDYVSDWWGPNDFVPQGNSTWRDASKQEEAPSRRHLVS